MKAIKENPAQRESIMVVDDNPANLKLMEEMLRRYGYEVRSFPRGRLALAAVERRQPDLILLDVNMPELNGFQVCEQLKSDPRLSRIPVIFLSALNETIDKVKAFSSGGADFISKPFQFEEVHARVKTHLELYALQTALLSQNEQLERTVAMRTRELSEAHMRLTILDRAKSDFLQLISHEFRTPLVGILGVGDLLLEERDSSAEDNELRQLYDQSRKRALSILDDALLLTQMDVNSERFQSSPVSLTHTLRRAIELTSGFAQSSGVRLGTPPPDLPMVIGNEELLVRAFQALLETAVKLSVTDGIVSIGHEFTPDSIWVVIESPGKSIPAVMLPAFFDLFSAGWEVSMGADLGLGPPVASRILSLFGASVCVSNCDPIGIRLTVRLNGVSARPDSNLQCP
jgi:two-component system sensor histidine kinase/response regulator